MDRVGGVTRGSGLPWAAGDYELLRDQVRRFVDKEIKPHADRWEEEGFIPRPVLRRMGELGFFGIRYPAEYGGSGMDAVASTVFAEELGRSTYGGVAIATLVHTDMASVHVFHDGNKAQRTRWMPGIVSGEVITAIAITEPDAGSDVRPSAPAPAGTAIVTSSTARSSTSRTASTRTSTVSPPRRIRRPGATGSRCSSSRRARRASR
jgi:acyl-CoA dehydrogenase